MSSWSRSRKIAGPLVRAAAGGQRCAAASSPVASATVPAAAPATSARRVIVWVLFVGMTSSRVFCLDRAGESHHLQRGATSDAVRIAEGLLHLEVIVSGAGNEFHLFAGIPQCSSKVSRLTLKFGCFQCSGGEDERRSDPVDVALGGKRLLGRIVDCDIRRALRQTHRLEVVHAAAQDRTLEKIVRKLQFLPLGNDD